MTWRCLAEGSGKASATVSVASSSTANCEKSDPRSSTRFARVLSGLTGKGSLSCSDRVSGTAKMVTIGSGMSSPSKG
jgi:hypothetical protein